MNSTLSTGWDQKLGVLSRRVDDAARFAWACSAQRTREQTLSAMLEQAVHSVRADVGAVVSLREGRLVSLANLGLDAHVVKELRHAGQSVVHSVMQSGRPLAALVEWDQPGTQRSLHVRSLLAVPVRAETTLVGIMLLVHGRTGERFTDEDQSVAELLASIGAVHVQNVEWMERTVERQCHEIQLGTARLVQRTLLPGPGTGPSWLHWESFYKPATAIGGEYFDLLHLPDDSVVVAVGDVCDHGIPSALLITAVRTLVRSLCLEGREPAAVLEAINRVLCADPSRPRELVATLFLASIHPGARLIRYANAGQTPPLLWDATRLIPAPLAPGSAPLGGSTATRFTPCELPLGSRVRLFLYSDGLLETGGRHGELFGLPRLLTSVTEQAGLSGAEFILGLRRRLEAFSGHSEPKDDLTMVWLGERS